jgi:SM-20-related protein
VPYNKFSAYPHIIDDVFDAPTWSEVLRYVAAQPMKYGAKSNSATDPHGHWSWKPVYDEQQNLADITQMLPAQLQSIWSRVQEKVPGPSVVIRAYANGYTYGTDGYAHVDSTRGDEHTIILFMCERWELDWAGDTVFFSNGDIAQAVLPRPNRAVIAPSNMLHAGRAVSRKCNEMRRVLVFKTRPRRDDHYEKISAWLAGTGAIKHKHAKGSLHDHLMRVYDLMTKHQCPLVACMGGAMHSVYGTNSFHTALLPRTPEYRASMAEYWSKEVESLVYLFSVLDRPQTLNTRPDPNGATALGLTHDAVQTIPNAMLHKLQLIEAANLLDQGQLGRWPVLKEIWEGEIRQ